MKVARGRLTVSVRASWGPRIGWFEGPWIYTHTCTSVRSHPVEPLDSFRGD